MVLAGLEVVVTGAEAELRVNDVPVVRLGGPGTSRGFMPAVAYVIRGENRLAARLVAVASSPPAASRAQIRLAIFDEGDTYYSNAGRELARLDWQGAPSPDLLATRFEAAFGPTGWSWMHCRRWLSAEQAIRDAHDFVVQLVRAYYQSDAYWIDEASQPKFADAAQAFTNMPESEMRRITSTLIAQTPKVSVPVDVAPIQPQLCGDGRLLELRDADGRPLIRKLDSRGQPFEPAILIGNLEGRWQIVR